ncbi:MAG: HAMP domain-containing histidine kinase [Clostridia bacterium]|nr:HAMP domain-containing histidine kinase [Clostridia bacterium]
MFKSIFSRLFWTNIIVIMLVFLCVCTSFAVIVTDSVADRQYELAMKFSRNINTLTGYLQIENNNVRSRKFYVDTLRNWSDMIGADIVVADLDGDIVESTNKDIKEVPYRYAKAVYEGKTVRNTSRFSDAYKGKVLTVAIPLEYYGTAIGGIYINTPMPTLSEMVGKVLLWVLLIGSVAILLAFALIYYQSARISAPLNKLNSAALDIAAGNFDERIAISGNDEISQLASSFNFMADSLQKLDDMRNRFISDISHELRTPMTSISGFVSGILDGTIPPEKQEDYLKIVLSESDRLKKLVTDMLEMSKMSSSEYKLNVSEFDFVELARICIIGLEQKICEKELDLNVDFALDSIKVCADRDAIQRVLINLIDNAIKFSYPKTTVEIKMWVDKKKAYFSVGNFGEGIDKTELPHVFDRFYKTDTSRTNKSTGAGLGLSFVKNIMLLHKQSIWVDSHEAKEGSAVKITTFSFSLELA